MITREYKEKVVTQLKELQEQKDMSQAKFARIIGISASQWNRMRKGDLDNVLADSKFITIAREQGLQLNAESSWKIVKTPAFEYINKMLTKCYTQSVSYVMVDVADLGKTETAKHFAKHNRFVAYVDCSQVKTKQLLVRFIARQFGVNHVGRYADVYAELCYYLNSINDNVLIILDEAGDLKYDAFLEIKALWNATENQIGWFMMGADGLRAKMDRAIANEKVGYVELFRRFDTAYKRVTPMGADAMEDFRREQIRLVAKANAPIGFDVNKFLKFKNNSLTSLKNAIRVANSQMAV